MDESVWNWRCCNSEICRNNKRTYIVWWTTEHIIIKDAETEEVVYTSTDLNVNKVYVDLAGEEKGKYILEIQLSEEAFTGDFELE